MTPCGGTDHIFMSGLSKFQICYERFGGTFLQTTISYYIFTMSTRPNVIYITSHIHVTFKKALWKWFLKMTLPFMMSKINVYQKQWISFLPDSHSHLWLLEGAKAAPSSDPEPSQLGRGTRDWTRGEWTENLILAVLWVMLICSGF